MGPLSEGTAANVEQKVQLATALSLVMALKNVYNDTMNYDLA